MNLNKKPNLVTLYASRPDAQMNCGNCAHRVGGSHMFWKCIRTGYSTDTEMKYGGKCAQGDQLLLWAPRRSLARRFLGMFFVLEQP